MGQAILMAWAGWIGSFVNVGDRIEGLDLVLALWAMQTWFAPRWPNTAYLHLLSEGPGCGKSTTLRVVGSLSLRQRQRSTLRVLSVVRDIEENGGAVTYFFDQIECLQSAKMTDDKSMLLDGYAAGGSHGVSVGTRQVEFSTYCAKAFGSIGDMTEDMRERCLLVLLRFGVPVRDWADAALTRTVEADALLAQFQKLFAGDRRPEWIAPDWLHGREKQIVTPLWSVALALRLEPDTLLRVKRALSDLIEYKARAPRIVYHPNAAPDVAVQRNQDSERVLRDLVGCLPVASAEGKPGPSGNISTVAALDALRAIDGPWRVYRGVGLDADTLAALLGRFGVAPEPIRVNRGRGRQLRGYDGRKLRAALRKASEGGE